MELLALYRRLNPEMIHLLSGSVNRPENLYNGEGKQSAVSGNA